MLGLKPFLPRVFEEAAAFFFAEPTRYVRWEMGKLGWSFRPAQGDVGRNGESSGSLLVYTPEGDLAHACDAEAVDGIPGGYPTYVQARSAVIRRIPLSLFYSR